MSSDYNVSYSYSMGGQAPKPASGDTTLYTFEDCDEVNLGNGAVVLVNRTRGIQGVVTRDVAIALSHCRDLRSLQGHAEYLTQYMPELGGDVGGVLQVLETVRDTGLLVPSSAYEAVIRACPVDADSPAPSRVFIITCDRPAAVERLLESLLACGTLGSHDGLYLVDDSRDGDNAARNRDLVETFNLHSARPMNYFGTEEREGLAAGLAERLPQHAEAVRFLLDREQWQGHKTYGLSRNICLLLSVGYRAVVMDDDVLCTAIDSPFKLQGMQFKDGMSEAEFYPTENAWRSSNPARGEDPLSGHLRCLGRGLGDALAALQLDAPGAGELTRSHGAVLAKVSANSRVLVTQNGTYGDPGTGDTAWCFNLDGDSLDRLLAEPGPTPKMAIRQYWMGWSRPTFSSRANMSQVTGLDNSAMLPPYFPAWRGEDQVFGAMVEYLYPDSLVLNYPWAVPHLPFEERTGDITPHPENGGMGMIESHITDNVSREPGPTVQTRLAGLVLLVQSLAERSDSSLGGAFRAALAEEQGGTVRALAEKLKAAPESAQKWRSLLEHRQQAFLQALAKREVPVKIGGVPEGMSEEELWQRFRELAAGFAGALQAWPEIREAAASLTGNDG